LWPCDADAVKKPGHFFAPDKPRRQFIAAPGIS
jgi:hypothetical protein